MFFSFSFARQRLSNALAVAATSAITLTFAGCSGASSDSSQPQSPVSESASAPVVNQPTAHILLSISNLTGKPAKIYYQVSPSTYPQPPGFACDTLGARLLWSAVTVPAATTAATPGKWSLASANSSNNICLSVGVPTTSTPSGPNPGSRGPSGTLTCEQSNTISDTPNDQSYNGPYLLQNTDGGLFIQQNWESSPVSNVNCFGGATLAVNSKWAPGNDAYLLTFSRSTDTSGQPTVTISVTDQDA